MLTLGRPEALLREKTVLVVGLGGLGCPAALALARAGVGTLVLCDDDRIQVSNLHRQILYTPQDVGRDKLDAARDALTKVSCSQIVLKRTRLLPDLARELVGEVDLVVEGADNFATKFLTADACFIEKRPVVHGAAVRSHGTAWSISHRGAPCYRCLFEDVLPDSDAPNCSEAGVLGPVVGVVGAIMADLALDVLLDDRSRVGRMHSFDGTAISTRDVAISPRADCALCSKREPGICDTRSERYFAPPSSASGAPTYS